MIETETLEYWIWRKLLCKQHVRPFDPHLEEADSLSNVSRSRYLKIDAMKCHFPVLSLTYSR
jgi:hypothetical protein